MVELLYMAPVYDPSGYSSAAREYIFSLHKAGVKVKVEPINFWSSIERPALNKELTQLLNELEHTKVSDICPRIQHIVPDCYNKNRVDRLEIGYTVFETDKCPPGWIPKMMEKNQIWVPCKFNLETFAKGGMDVNKMRVIPHIANTELFDPDKTEPLDIPIKKDFYFLTVMDVTARKGWDILLKAYLREFRQNDNVGLIFKGYYGGVGESHKKQLLNKLRAFRDGLQISHPPDIIFFGDILENQDMARLYKSCHCFVLPSRGEGFSLGHLESMAMELPSIGPSWGGNLEFMNKENSYLIDILEFRSTENNKELLRITPNYAGQNFCEPSESHLRQLMRQVYDNYSEAKVKGKKARQDLITNFSGEVIAKKIIQEIS